MCYSYGDSFNDYDDSYEDPNDDSFEFYVSSNDFIRILLLIKKSGMYFCVFGKLMMRLHNGASIDLGL